MMKFEIKHCFTRAILFECEAGSIKLAVELAVKEKADLRCADLGYADLRSADLGYANLRCADLRCADLGYADLRSADLGYANLRCADLRSADLGYADLGYANLRCADLRSADLGYANLRCADLRSADLRSADLDFSSWPLHCGSFTAKADDRIVAQLFAHWARLDVSNCSPYVRYVHRFTVNQFGKYMANLFCKFREDVKPI
jgi:hypothetical protein